MSDALRLSSLALFAVGPVVAVLAPLGRGLKPSPTLARIRGWRWYVPVVLLPVEWLLPPALIALRVRRDRGGLDAGAGCRVGRRPSGSDAAGPGLRPAG